MEIPLISGRQFNRFKKFLPVPSPAEKITGIIVLSCAIWVFRYGRSWNEIPETYGKFDTIRKRFSRWSKLGLFRKVFYFLVSKLKKLNDAMLDSTAIKAHRTSASPAADDLPRQIGRSTGGLTTKIHLLATIEKMPLDFTLTEGQKNDGKEGFSLLQKNSFKIKSLLADKAYDTSKICKILFENYVVACIPAKINRKLPAAHDENLYKKRSGIENMFAKLKDWRGIAMRYCRCAHTFDSGVCLALITIFFNVR